MTSFKERSLCGRLSPADVGKKVQVIGWVDALRDHGVVLFAHIRDRSGIVQAVFNPETTPAVRNRASELREEFCVMVAGRLVERAQGTENPAIDTGRIEIIADDLTVLSTSEVLPFHISEKAMVAGAAVEAEAVSEERRLEFRYLDLRRPSMRRKLTQRHRIMQAVRAVMEEREFVEVETPVLTKSTPEGARDYLVPSRIHQGHFYALPQSPQLFKQLLMISGLERYYQIVKCYRDEDLRPNRQPEFTQLDVEASFIDEEFIYGLIEEVVGCMFAVGGIELPRPFPRMTYTEAIDSTGSDRPDLRFGLRFVDATDIFHGTEYGIFRRIIEAGGCIKGMVIKGKSDALSKNVLQNEYAKKIVPSFGAKGMTWMRVVDGKLESNIVQFFGEEEQRGIIARFGGQDGDVIMMIADASPRVVTSALGLLRLDLAERLELIPAGQYCPVWVTDFPLFEKTPEGITSIHHPFTAPHRTDFDPTNRDEVLALRSRAYDIVVNGEELGGGSIRIHQPEVQRKIFAALGLTDAEMEEKFGFFLRALKYGAPPHGGIALGMDRAVAMVLGTPSIREVIAFPKNRRAGCPLTNAPSTVHKKQLRELGLLKLAAQYLPKGKGRET